MHATYVVQLTDARTHAFHSTGGCPLLKDKLIGTRPSSANVPVACEAVLLFMQAIATVAVLGLTTHAVLVV